MFSSGPDSDIFIKSPTRIDQIENEKRKNLFVRSISRPEEMIRELSTEYFCKNIAMQINNPEFCLLQLNSLIENHLMAYLSDLVAMCISYHYNNPNRQRQAIELLEKCISREYIFNPDEMRSILYTIGKNPPTLDSDIKKCASTIFSFAKKEATCRKQIIEQMKTAQTNQQKKLFTEIAARLIKVKDIPANDNKTLEVFAKGQFPSNPVVKDGFSQINTPTAKELHHIEMDTKVKRTFSCCEGKQIYMYLIFTILVFLGLIVFVLAM